jgi:hypothetical protein
MANNFSLGDINFDAAAAAAPPAKKRRTNKRGVVHGESGGLTALKNKARDFSTSEGWKQLKVTNSVFRYVSPLLLAVKTTCPLFLNA